MPTKRKISFDDEMNTLETSILNKSKGNKMKIGSIVTTTIAGIVALVVLFGVGGSFYTVDQGEEAVILRNGAYVSTEGPGFHVKIPFIDDVKEVSLRQYTQVFESMEAYSNDQQPAGIRLSVTIQANPGAGEALYAQYGGLDGFVSRVVNPRVPALFKNVFGQYKAEQAIQQREKLNLDALTEIKEGIPNDLVQVVSVQVEDIAFSQTYIDTIEQKQLATVEVQRRQQLLAQEQIQAQIVVTQAQAQADSQLAVATANAKAIILQGEAEAEAIKARGDALRDNPDLVALTTAEKWNGQLPTTIPPNGSVPFLNVNPR